MPSFPAVNYLSDNARNKGNMKTAFEAWLAKCRLLVGGSPITTYTVSGGSITPNAPHFSVAGEGGVADDLTNVVTTNFDAGSVIEFRADSGSAAITVKHGAGGAGNFSTRDGADIVLNDTIQYVRFLQVSGNWVEISRSEKQATTGLLGIAKAASIAVTDALVSVTDFVTPAGLAKHSPLGVMVQPLPASSWEAATTNPCGTSKIETTTNKVGIGTVLDFDPNTMEHAWIKAPIPKGVDITAGVKFRVRWRAESGSGGVAFNFAAIGMGDNDVHDDAYGTAQTITDTLLNTAREHVSAWSSNVVTIKNAASEDTFYGRLSRDPANGSDSLAVDARVIAVELQWTVAKGNDA